MCTLKQISKIKIGLLFGIALLLSVAGCRKSEYYLENVDVITDLGGGTGTVTWTSDKSYLISGFVFVNDGQTLTIEPGTVVRAKTGQGSLASALIVARGGHIIAEGTSSDPIIFTVEDDDLEGSVPLEARGLWGGLIILGHAPVNTDSGEDMIEGIPLNEPRGVYGGIDEDDNSGILRFVSIRHGGTNIGEGNEINGLTLGGVGRQTVINHVEVIANEDDGVEFFGGTVNCKNIVVSYSSDDAFDIDQGYRGKCQFLLGINHSYSDKGIECSGGLQPLQLLPDAFPTLYNVTLIGYPENNTLPLIDFYSFGAGHLRNSLLQYPGKGIAISNSGASGDAYSMFENGSLTLDNNEFYDPHDSLLNIYCYNEVNDPFLTENAILADSLEQWNNFFSNPLGLNGARLQLLPQSTVFEALADFNSKWYEQVPYKGAFGSENWIEGWTLLWAEGLTGILE
jgi:hypothetical protein